MDFTVILNFHEDYLFVYLFLQILFVIILFSDQLSPENRNSTISYPNNLNEKEVTKSHDVLQPITKQSGFPSMVPSSSLLGNIYEDYKI